MQPNERNELSSEDGRGQVRGDDPAACVSENTSPNEAQKNSAVTLGGPALSQEDINGGSDSAIASDSTPADAGAEGTSGVEPGNAIDAEHAAAADAWAADARRRLAADAPADVPADANGGSGAARVNAKAGKVAQSTASPIMDEVIIAQLKKRDVMKEKGLASTDLGLRPGDDPFELVFKVPKIGFVIAGTNYAEKIAADFNYDYAPYFYALPESVRGELKSAIGYLRRSKRLGRAKSTAPGYGLPLVFDYGQDTFVNTWRKRSMPCDAEKITEAGRAAFKLQIQHIHNLFGPDQAKILINWIAMNLKRPGDPIGWAILMYGPEGIGKSMIDSRLGIALMGVGNCKPVSNDSLSNQWTDTFMSAPWMVLKEIAAKTGDPHDGPMNRVKTLITDGEAELVRKGIPTVIVQVRSNYIGSTNNIDAISMDDGTRRWCPLRTLFDTKAEFVAFLAAQHADAMERKARGEEVTEVTFASHEAYYAAVAETFNYGPELVKQWKELVLDEGFGWTMGAAPETDFRRQIIGMTEERAGVTEKDISYQLRKGGYGYNEKVVVTKWLSNDLELCGKKISRYKLARLLAKLNFDKHDPLELNGETIRVWHAKKLKLHTDSRSNDEVKKLLDEAMPPNSVGTPVFK